MPPKRRKNGRAHAHTNGSPASTGSGNQPLKNRPQDAAPKAVDDEFLRTRALELRREGASYRTIAQTMTHEMQQLHAAGKLTESRTLGKDIAHRLVLEGLRDLREHNAETADDVRRLEIERLDNWLLRLSTGQKRNEPRTIDTMLRIQERRARLLDLDLATTKIVGADGGPIDVQYSDKRAAVHDKLDRLRASLLAPVVAGAAGAMPPSTTEN